MVTTYALMSLWVLGRMRRDERAIQESLEAVMHGQEHIAELVAEVLRRQR